MILARSKSSLWLHVVFGVLLIANFAFWVKSRHILPQWDNVPAAPNKDTASFSGLGDSEISYRLAGYFLQNLGNVGGMYKPLKDYDYDLLGQWFTIAQSLDPRSNYVPFMAAYYFGSVQEGYEYKLTPVIDYLSTEGQAPYPQKWRWLAQAIYLARFRQHDMDKALDLANILANLKTNTAPWARQMPAFIHMQMGNKEAAYQIMIRMLATEQNKLPASEVNEMRNYICERTLEPAEAAKNPLCQPEQ